MALAWGIFMLALFADNSLSTTEKNVGKFKEISVEKDSWDAMEISARPSRVATFKK